MTNEEYTKMLNRIHTDVAAQEQVLPLWQDFVSCRISSAEYMTRLAALEACIKRARSEEAAEKRMMKELQKKGLRDMRKFFAEG